MVRCKPFDDCMLSVDIRVVGILLDELAPWFHVIAHEHGEYLVCLSGILYGHLLEQARFWIHGGFPELLGIHLAETFVSLCMYALAIVHTVSVFVEECLTLLFGITILLHLVLIGTEIEWGGGDIEVSLLDDPWHETIEQCHDKRVDV